MNGVLTFFQFLCYSVGGNVYRPDLTLIIIMKTPKFCTSELNVGLIFVFFQHSERCCSLPDVEIRSVLTLFNMVISPS